MCDTVLHEGRVRLAIFDNRKAIEKTFSEKRRKISLEIALNHVDSMVCMSTRTLRTTGGQAVDKVWTKWDAVV
jgi:hypothetical protein